MLAAKMYGKNDIRLEEAPRPVPGEGELLVRVKAAAICGTDVRMLLNGASGISVQSPRILGHEFSGVIEETGAGVRNYRPGQRVAVAPNMGCGVCEQCVSGNGHLCKSYKALGINLDGAFAEYVAIPEEAVRGGNVCVLEDHVSFQEGAVNEPLSCVCNGFERSDIRPGESVLIIGAGPIGIMHAMMAKMAGASLVMISDLSKERLAMCRQADDSFCTLEGSVQEAVEEMTKGHGADVCITACPSPQAQETALEAAALGGRVIFFGGIPADRQNVTLNTNLIHYKELRVSGTTRASLSQYRKTLHYITTGVLDVKRLITRTMPLQEIEKGFQYAACGTGLKNVICM